MKSTEIQHNVQLVIDNFSKEEFIYDLLIPNSADLPVGRQV
jgi:hypothetical protein